MHTLQGQATLIAVGFAIHASDQLVAVQKRQGKVPIATLRLRHVAFNLIVKIKQRP
jgi:hypothetical protein